MDPRPIGWQLSTLYSLKMFETSPCNRTLVFVVVTFQTQIIIFSFNYWGWQSRMLDRSTVLHASCSLVRDYHKGMEYNQWLDKTNDQRTLHGYCFVILLQDIILIWGLEFILIVTVRFRILWHRGKSNRLLQSKRQSLVPMTCIFCCRG